MTKETEVALAAIDALCKKRKAKVLRKLVLAAVESERTRPTHGGGLRIDCLDDGVTLTDIGGSTTTIWDNTDTDGTITSM